MLFLGLGVFLTIIFLFNYGKGGDPSLLKPQDNYEVQNEKENQEQVQMTTEQIQIQKAIAKKRQDNIFRNCTTDEKEMLEKHFRQVAKECVEFKQEDDKPSINFKWLFIMILFCFVMYGTSRQGGMLVLLHDWDIYKIDQPLYDDLIESFNNPLNKVQQNQVINMIDEQNEIKNDKEDL